MNPDSQDVEGGDQGWTELARNSPGVGVSQETVRRRFAEGEGADRSWWVGEAGEVHIGEVLAPLAQPSRWQRLRGQPAAWRVLHSVPLRDAAGEGRGDIDHVLIGPPGVVTINTKHHRAAGLLLDGDTLTVNSRPVDYIRKARVEALRALDLLQPALVGAGHQRLAEQLQVRPVIVVVGARLVVQRPADRVVVRMPKSWCTPSSSSPRPWTTPTSSTCSRSRAGPPPGCIPDRANRIRSLGF